MQAYHAARLLQLPAVLNVDFCVLDSTLLNLATRSGLFDSSVFQRDDQWSSNSQKSLRVLRTTTKIVTHRIGERERERETGENKYERDTYSSVWRTKTSLREYVSTYVTLLCCSMFVLEELELSGKRLLVLLMRPFCLGDSEETSPQSLNASASACRQTASKHTGSVYDSNSRL